MDVNTIQKVLIYILIFLLVLIVCREVICWFFKINEIVKLLKKISENH